MNRTECTLTVDRLRAEGAMEGSMDEDGDRLGGVRKATKKRGKNWRLVLLPWLTCAFDAWGFTIAGSLATIVPRKNEAISVG
ncbi:hypothetical protein FRC09_001899 [Ceratobasidium sp. 395]|nr:hypothetical protein FRC09_001899 [Ceratobasidium sp. 395]